MAKYTALADLWLPGNFYCRAGETCSDDGTGQWPIPTSYIPSVACDPGSDSDGQTKLSAAWANRPYPEYSHSGCFGYWGFAVKPSVQWQAIIHN